MEILGLFWIPDVLVWLLVLGTALYIYGTWSFGSLMRHGYAGPKPKPFIGNMDLLYGMGHSGAWDLAGKQQYGKLFAVYEGKGPALMIFDTDMIKQVLVKDFPTFENRRDLYLRRLLKYSLVDTNGDHWRRIRTLTTPFFTTGKLKKNMTHLEYCVENLKGNVEKFARSGEEFDIKILTGAFTLEAICLTAFGMKVDSQKDPDNFLFTTARKMATVNVNYWGFWCALLFPFAIPLLEWLGCNMWPEGSINVTQRLTKEALDERERAQSERPDFIQALINAHEAAGNTHDEGATEVDTTKLQPLTEDEVVAQVAVFILAGYDTTSTALSFLFYNLATNPQCQARLLQEIDDVIGNGEVTYEKLKMMTYLDTCLDESQRLFPSIFRTDRKCLKDTTVNGNFIPKDTLILIPIYALHHDPALWTNPEEFDPERFSPTNRSSINAYGYLPFGAGPRNCVGMRLAQMEIKMAVIKVIQNFKVTIGKKTQLPLKLCGLFPSVVGGVWLNAERRQAV